MRRPVVLVLLLLVAAATGGGWYALRVRTADQSAASGAARAPALATAVVTAIATRADFPVLLRSIGTVEPIATVVVKSRVQSQLLQQHFTEGQTVRKGDLLFTLDDRELAGQVARDEAALARDEATVARANADFERAQQLLQRNAGTRQALDQATADRATAGANAKASRATLEQDKVRLSYAKIYAPIDGRVGAVTVTPGNLVNAGESGPGLVTITSLKPVRVAFTLAERELGRVRAAADGQRPTVRVFPHGDEGKPIEGALIFIDSTVDQASGTIGLKAEFANEDLALWPGQYCDVEIEIGVRRGAVSIPLAALQPGQKGDFVLRVSPENIVAARDVRTGVIERGAAEIVEGLEPGDKVVVEGQARLRDGARVREVTAAR